MGISNSVKTTGGFSKTNYSTYQSTTDSYITVPRVQKYSTSNVPMMHRAFRNLEIAYANNLVNIACNTLDKTTNQLRVLDIGFGLGYSAQAFLNVGVGTYHCIEINSNLVSDAQGWLAYWCQLEFGQPIPEDILVGCPLVEGGGVEIINDSCANYCANYEPVPVDKGGGGNGYYDIIYYSPSVDDFGDCSSFMGDISKVSTNGTLLGIQGVPLFSNLSLANFNTPDLADLPVPDADTYDSIFTTGLFNALNNIGYWNVYYQWRSCTEGPGGALGGIGAGAPICSWIPEPPNVKGK